MAQPQAIASLGPQGSPAIGEAVSAERKRGWLRGSFSVEQIVHCGPQPEGPRPRPLGGLDVVLREVGPSLRDADGAVDLLNSPVEVS